MARRWIATAHDHFNATDAVVVEHHDEAEAARLAALALRADAGDAADIENVFIAPWDGGPFPQPWAARVAYTIIAAVERSELQCCGGGDNVPGYVGCAPHWAGCPNAPDDPE